MKKKDLDKIKNNRIIRLMEDILGYNFATQHLKGEQNQVADYLSRNPLEGELAPDYPRLLRESVPASVNLITAGKVVDLSLKRLAPIGAEDEEYKNLIACIKTKTTADNIPKDDKLSVYKPIWNSLAISEESEGKVVVMDSNRLVVPPSMRKSS